MKNRIAFTTLAIILLSGCSSGVPQQEHDALRNQLEELQSQYAIDKEMEINFTYGKRAGIYTGQISNGIPNGEGAFTTQSNEGVSWTYRGEWIDGHFSGNGGTFWEDGDIQVGAYSNDILVKGAALNPDLISFGWIDSNSESSSNTTSENLDEYKELVSKFNNDIMAQSLLLSNMGKWEYNYWKAYNSLDAKSPDFDSMTSHAYELLVKNAEVGEEEIANNYKSISEQYKQIVVIDISGSEAGEIKESFKNLYDAYSSLYKMTTSPSGSLSSFSDNYNTYTDDIVKNNEMISLLIE